MLQFRSILTIPVWVRMWRLSNDGRSNALPHTWQGSRVLSRFLLGIGWWLPVTGSARPSFTERLQLFLETFFTWTAEISGSESVSYSETVLDSVLALSELNASGDSESFAFCNGNDEAESIRRRTVKSPSLLKPNWSWLLTDGKTSSERIGICDICLHSFGL